ncbi:MAG: hypothetical protein AB7O67_16055 [Vicinamibacterales bacterium]
MLAPLAASQASLPFTLGIAGSADAIVPFATWDGQRWKNSWPEPVDDARPPLSFEDIPAEWWGAADRSETWELLTSDGRRLGTRITGAVGANIGSGCANTPGLTTSVPDGTYALQEGLATSRPGLLEPVRTLAPGGADWRSIASRLEAVFALNEPPVRLELGTAPGPDPQAPLAPPVLEAAFVSTDAGAEIAYAEASRRHASADTLIGTWLWRASPASAFQVVGVRSGLHWPDGKGMASLRPLGLVRVGEHRFWAGVYRSYAYAAPAVLEVGQSGVREWLVVDFPGC